MYVQSIAGFLTDRFQITGEVNRHAGSKILISCRIDRMQFEKIKSNAFQLTVAHQWIWPSFQLRFGGGVQYAVLSGRDLDNEILDQAGFLPVSDMAFYWRF
jgi:hypothetical protein